jgi:CDP-diacylglycerol--glycerol-3-phosphate 3-phosphatidyltransferase
MASSTSPSQAPMLTAITSDLDKLAPKFEIDPDQITIIQTPAEFYETLKVGFGLVSCRLSCPSLFQSTVSL